MGGSMGLGNATPVAESNIYKDPEAAYVVCEYLFYNLRQSRMERFPWL